MCATTASPAARHLQVYRNNVFESLVGALKAVYPVVERLVGTGFFAYAADGYIRHHPPASGNLHDFGDSFAGFLAGFEPARALAYLPDVARLEWAWHRAFHAADRAPLALERLAAVPPERYGQVRFRLHPSAQFIASDYPLLRIWRSTSRRTRAKPQPVEVLWLDERTQRVGASLCRTAALGSIPSPMLR